MTILSEPVTTYNQLLGELEAALREEALCRERLTFVKDTLSEQEARAAIEERNTGRKMTESEVKERVAMNQVITTAQDSVRGRQMDYDLARAQVEIARHRIAFALASFKSIL